MHADFSVFHLQKIQQPHGSVHRNGVHPISVLLQLSLWLRLHWMGLLQTLPLHFHVGILSYGSFHWRTHGGLGPYWGPERLWAPYWGHGRLWAPIGGLGPYWGPGPIAA